MELTMRSLKTKDIPKFAKVLKKLNLKHEIKQIFMQDIDEELIKERTEGKTNEEKVEALKKLRNEVMIERGIDILFQIIENYDQASQEIDNFMSDLLGIKPNEFAELDIDKTFEAFMLLKQQEKLMNFFTLVLK